MLDTQFLRPSLHFITLLPTTLHATSLQLSTLHFLSFKLHPATLHYPLIWPNPTWHCWGGRFLTTDPRDHLHIPLCRMCGEENSEEMTVYATLSVLHCWLPFHRGRTEPSVSDTKFIYKFLSNYRLLAFTEHYLDTDRNEKKVAVLLIRGRYSKLWFPDDVKTPI
jgi:hypothetical protein